MARGRDKQTFYNDMTAGLPQGTLVTVGFGNTAMPSSICWDYQGQTPDETIGFWRTFKKTPDGNKILYASHVDDGVGEAFQGQGIWSNINKKCLHIYNALDIDHARIVASEIGPYADARLGFHPDEDDWAENAANIRARLEFVQSCLTGRFGDMPEKSVENIRTAIADKDPKALWRIVDDKTPYAATTVGKLMTVRGDFLPLDTQAAIDMEKPFMKTPFESACWKGRMELKDPQTIKRYMAYFEKTPKPQPAVTASTKPSMG